MIDTYLFAPLARVSFIESLISNPEFSPLLIGLIIISTYLVFNVGFVFKLNRQKNTESIQDKKYLPWYYIRSFLFIGLSPIIHTYTIFYLSKALVQDLSRVEITPDFLWFHIFITLFLSIALVLGLYSFNTNISSVRFSRWTSFSISYSQKDTWTYVRLVLRALSALSVLSIFVLILMLIF